MTYRTLVSHTNSPVWKPYSVSAIAYHKHLYTQILNGVENDDLEIMLSRDFESPANQVIDKATADQRLTKEDWHILIRFLAAQDVRTPLRLQQYLDQNVQSMQKLLDETLDDVKQKLESGEMAALKQEANSYNSSSKQPTFPLKVITESEPDSDIATLRVETFIGRSSWIYSIKHQLESTVKVLLAQKWSIVKPAKGYYWFTSDNPVIKLNYTNLLNYDLLGGWGRNKGNIIFPIGPEHAMFVQIGDKPFPKEKRLNLAQTLEFRKFIAENSHRMIFSCREDNDVLRLKRRTVNHELIKKEYEAMQNWHLKNSELEREYSNSESTVKENI